MRSDSLNFQFRLLIQSAAIVQRHHFLEQIAIPCPVVENLGGTPALCQFAVAPDQVENEMLFLRVRESFKIDHLQVTSLSEVAFLIDDVSNAPAHSRGKVSTGSPEYDDSAAGHVLATMVADALNHSGCSAVTNSKAFPGHS